MQRCAPVSLLLALCLLALPALAENVTRVDGYAIHHNALTTDMLAPEVARAYGIQRSSRRGMINISVIRETPDTTGRSVPARVKVTARTLTGQTREMPLREIREADAIYYIADFPVAHREHLIFDVEVVPEGETRPLKARFEQEFFTR